MRKTIFVAALALASFAAGNARAAITFLDATVVTGSFASADWNGASNFTDSHSTPATTAAFADLFPGLSCEYGALAMSGQSAAGASAYDFERVLIRSATPSDGYFDFYGQSFAVVGSLANGGSASAGSAGSQALYAFSITGAPYTFDIGYEASGTSGSEASYQVSLLTSTLSTVGSFAVGANDSGAMSYALDPGSYVFTVEELAGGGSPDAVLEKSLATQVSGTSEAFFTFGMRSAVPEPSTWVLMGLGFAGLVAMARRRSGGAGFASSNPPRSGSALS